MLRGNCSTFSELIEVVMRESDLKNDLMGVDASKIVAADVDGEARLEIALNEGSDETTSFSLLPVAHQNLASELTPIGMRYYKTLLERSSKEAWAYNVNLWLNKNTPRFVRTFDGAYEEDFSIAESPSVRCLKSTQYWALDNDALLSQLIPQFERRDLEVLTCNLSERQMLIKAVSPVMVAEIPKVGDTVQAGIAIGNSEVGCGSLWIAFLDYVLECSNGMVGAKESRYTHRSGDTGEVADKYHTRTRGTRQKIDETFWAEIGEDIERVFDPNRFHSRISEYGQAAEDEVPEGRETAIISKVCLNAGIPKDEIELVLRRYQIGVGAAQSRSTDRNPYASRWGVAQAVTAYAHKDVADCDLALKYEEEGRKIISYRGALPA